MPTISFDGWFYAHAPQEIKDRNGERARKSHQAKLNRARMNVLSSKVWKAQKDVSGLKTPKKGITETLEYLLKLADGVFRRWLIKQVVDSSSMVTCPCCNKKYHIEAKTPDGDKVVQVLHFISRKVVQLRYSYPHNTVLGCCYCNLAMYIEPKGEAYQNYRAYLVGQVGEFTVAHMETEKYKLQKFSHNDLREIVKKYGGSLPKQK